MASNKDIAIQWAKAAVLQDQLVWSDQFFNPFNENMRMSIIRHLAKEGIIAWWDTKNGAFIFKENDPRFKLIQVGNYFGGTFRSGPEDNPHITILPILEVE